VNGKLRPAVIVSGLGRGRREETSGKGEFKYDIFDIIIRTFVNSTSTHSSKKKNFF
jgi:hypothetical protein